MKYAKSAALAFAVLFITAVPAMAQTTPTPAQTNEYKAREAFAASNKYPFSDLRAFGAGLVIIGASMGIGGLAKAAVESMARQPEVAGQINTSMIIAAALIEGVTFFALIIIIIQTAY